MAHVLIYLGVLVGFCMILDRYASISHLQLELPEGLIWDATNNKFLFVDITKKTLYGLTVNSTINVKLLSVFDGEIGCVFTDKYSPSYLCAVTPKLTDWPHVSQFSKQFDFTWPYDTGYRFNDGLLDGNLLWVGILSMMQPDRASTGGLFGISDQAGVFFEDRTYQIPNGPVISYDKKWLIHSDSAKGLIYGYEYKGSLTSPKSKIVLIDLSNSGGNPDGMVLDPSGNLYVAMWGLGQIWKFDTNYRYSSMIDVKNKFVTNMAFGGENLDRLFVTYAQDKALGKFGGICEVINNKTLGAGNYMSNK